MGQCERIEGTIADDVYARATSALGSLPVAERTDTYVVSFFVYDHEDDPRRPMLTIGTNTERQVAGRTPVASDAAEARWNYAFWLQNELAIVGGPLDPDGERVVDASFGAAGLGFADDDCSDEALEIGDEIVEQNRSANPPELVHEFAAWVESF